MVEVLEKREPKKYRIVCHGCNSLLRFSKLDEKSEYTPDSIEGQSTDWYIICPNCNTRVPTHSLTEKNSYDWRKSD